MQKTWTSHSLALVVVCAALNLGLGFLVAAVKLPFYLDSIGTVLATAIGGLPIGVATGLLSVVVGSTYTPTLWAYAGTAVAVAIYVSAVRRLGYLDSWLPTFFGGLGLGVLSAILSAPVTAYLWGGVSLAGADFVTAYFKAVGQTLLDSVILGGLATDPVDKIVTSLVAFAVLQRVPSSLRRSPSN